MATDEARQQEQSDGAEKEKWHNRLSGRIRRIDRVDAIIGACAGAALLYGLSYVIFDYLIYG